MIGEVTKVNPKFESWSTLDIEHRMDLLESDLVGIEIQTELDASQAARFLGALKAKERELLALREWYEKRRASLMRSTGWLELQLEGYAKIEFRRTGLHSFPVGTAIAKIRKAPPVTVWDDDRARPWLLELAKEWPSVIKDFSRRQAMAHVRWSSQMLGDGTVEAVDSRTGEILPGLRRDMRPGQVTVSIKDRSEVADEKAEGETE